RSTPATGLDITTRPSGWKRAFGPADPLTLRTRYALVRTLAYSNTAAHITEAGALLDATDAMLGTGLHGDDDLALDAAYARGVFHFQQLQIEPALQAYRRADRLQRLLQPDDALMAAAIRENIADGTLRQGDLAGAVAQLREIGRAHV